MRPRRTVPRSSSLGGPQGEPGEIHLVPAIGAAFPIGIRKRAFGVDFGLESWQERRTIRCGAPPTVDSRVETQVGEAGSPGPLTRKGGGHDECTLSGCLVPTE